MSPLITILVILGLIGLILLINESGKKYPRSNAGGDAGSVYTGPASKNDICDTGIDGGGDSGGDGGGGGD